MNPTRRRQALRKLLTSETCVYPGSVYDAISARIAEDLGYETGMVGGSTASLAVLGAPDHIVMTLTELADQVRRICRAGELPIIVDADHGFGRALNVMRTVEELENAGAAALTIEDTDLPRPFGATGPRILSREEGLGKIKAALAARTDADFVVIGRTSAIEITDLDDAIGRARAYEEAGVDAMFFTGVSTRAQLDRLADELRGPFVLGGAGDDLADRSYLASRRVRVFLQGHQAFMAGVAAVHSTLKALRDGTAPKDLKGLPSPELAKAVTRDSAYSGWIRDYLG